MSTIMDVWGTLEFAFIASVIFIAIWRTLHYVSVESYAGANRLGNWLHEKFGRGRAR